MENLVIDEQAIKVLKSHIDNNDNIDEKDKEQMFLMTILIANGVKKNLPWFISEQNLGKRLENFQIKKGNITDKEPVKLQYDKEKNCDIILLAPKELDEESSKYDGAQLLQKGLLEILLSTVESQKIGIGFNNSDLDMTAINTGYIMNLLQRISVYDDKKESLCEFYQEEMALVNMLDIIVGENNVMEDYFVKNHTKDYINAIGSKGVKIETFKAMLESANYDLKLKTSSDNLPSQFKVTQEYLIDMLNEIHNLKPEMYERFKGQLILSNDRFSKPERYGNLHLSVLHLKDENEMTNLTGEKAHVK